MKKWKPIGITALEYKEYKQNGCIRVKDYPIPSKKKIDIENEFVRFNIYEILDYDEKESYYSMIPVSFSFGKFFIKRMYGGYEIDLMDRSMTPLVVRRLNRFGLHPEVDAMTGLIYSDKP